VFQYIGITSNIEALKALVSNLLYQDLKTVSGFHMRPHKFITTRQS